jgi:hypothetical protein
MPLDGYFYAALIVGLASTVICVVAAVRRLGPNDVTILSVAAVELVLLVYLVGSIIGSVTGAGPAGPAIEFWGYVLTALVLPVGAVYWSLLERSFWSNYVLAAPGIVVFIMMARMNQLWYGPVAA